MTANVGGSLTARTVTTNESVAIRLLVSRTSMVIVATPNAFGSGVIATVRLSPEPPKTISFVEISAGFEDDAVGINPFGPESTSATVKGIDSVGASSSITLSVMSEIEGGTRTVSVAAELRTDPTLLAIRTR